MRGLVWKAESQYNLANFEHSLKYFYRFVRGIKKYRDEINSLQIQLSRTQAGPGRAVKEEQEQNSPNHVQRINLISVL